MFETHNAASLQHTFFVVVHKWYEYPEITSIFLLNFINIHQLLSHFSLVESMSHDEGRQYSAIFKVIQHDQR